ncbi:MAG: hypothetical protein RR272_04595 [Synergistaceae bacterium]
MSSFNNRKSGTSFVEVMIYLVILGFFLAGVMMSFSDSTSELRVLNKEADLFAIWLDSHISTACREKSTFDLRLSARSQGNYELSLVYTTGPQMNTTDTFFLKEANLMIEGGTTQYVFDGRWGTMSPAMSMSVRAKNSDKLVYKNVTVSGAGFLSLSDVYIK